MENTCWIKTPTVLICYIWISDCLYMSIGFYMCVRHIWKNPACGFSLPAKGFSPFFGVWCVNWLTVLVWIYSSMKGAVVQHSVQSYKLNSLSVWFRLLFHLKHQDIWLFLAGIALLQESWMIFSLVSVASIKSSDPDYFCSLFWFLRFYCPVPMLCSNMDGCAVFSRRVLML